MSHIVFAYKFHDSKTCIPIADTDVSDAIKDTSLAWVHMNLNHPETRRWLENELSYLDSFVINALLAQETRPRMMQINDGILLNLRGVNLNEGANPSDMIAIRLWIDKNRIISVQRRQLKSIYDIQEMITHGKILKDSGDFLCLLISK